MEYVEIVAIAEKYREIVEKAFAKGEQDFLADALREKFEEQWIQASEDEAQAEYENFLDL